MSRIISYFRKNIGWQKQAKNSEFQRVFPQLFNVPFTITPEIEDVDRARNALVQELDEVGENTARYNDLEDAIWYAYCYEVNAFYEANAG